MCGIVYKITAAFRSEVSLFLKPVVISLSKERCTRSFIAELVTCYRATDLKVKKKKCFLFSCLDQTYLFDLYRLVHRNMNN